MNMPFLTMQALLGTDKRPPELPADDSEPGRLTQAIAATRDGSENAEALRLLRAAGVQAVCGLAGYQPAEPPAQPPAPVREEAILLGGLTKDRLDHLLAQLKESELTIELKAVITPYNREWTLSKLFSELQEEHRFFLRIQRLTQLTEQAEARADGNAELRAAALEGRRILEADKAPEPLTLQNAIEGLEAALSRL